MDRVDDDHTLEKTHDLLARSRLLLRQLDRRIGHADADLDAVEDAGSGQGGRLEDTQEPFIPPRRPK